jgi:CO/xanthine dehydrogenase FAD-binding subunit
VTQGIDSYLRPTTLAPALEFLAETSAAIVAGGTDHYPAAGPLPTGGPVLDVSVIDELRGIHRLDREHRDGDRRAGGASGVWRIGAATTWTELIEADLPPAFAGLQHAASMVGGVQIQNRASIGGNLCNASPAADGVPPLLTLDAEVELASAAGTRRLPLGRFITGNRTTERAPGEVLTAVVVPEPAEDAVGAFEKLGSRCYLVISIVMAAAVVRADDAGLIAEAKVAVGACSAVAQRLSALEQAIVGRPVERPFDQPFEHEFGTGPPGQPPQQYFAPLSPIDDIRAGADYRRSVAPTLVARAIGRCQGGER